MGMLLMLISLLGAVMVMAAGILVVRWGTRERAVRALETEPEPPGVSDGVGGYWPPPEGMTVDNPDPVLSPRTLDRVRELLASGRDGDAIEMVRAETGTDSRRAREAVDRIRRERPD